MAELPSAFGHYQILGPLGAGGMGQVYRARDTRLQRFVAIKVLHDKSALDAGRQRRFAQEAAAASALNHPNILTVYDIGIDGGVQYFVSELIDGESLRAELNRGHTPIKRVIDIVHQIAEGLAAAHGAGIVHRDLKPENVMVTPDGRVKIVDFGLAKTIDDDASSIVGAPGATQTAEGLIMGTVPYMSPEQARGSPADFRSDQFSLGVVLYELATGSHPFKRETPVQTMSATIAEEPPDPATLNPNLPVVLRWILRRLLAKAPRDRFAHTADLAADLRTLRENLSEATTMSGATPVIEQPRRRWPLLLTLGTFATAVLAAVTWALPLPEPDVHFHKYTPFATEAGYQGNPAWSPDGKAIAYEAEINGVVQIFTRTIGSALRTQVTSSRFDCFSPMWTADGYIYYISRAHNNDALYRTSPIARATPEPFVEDVSEAAISPDGRILFFLREESSQPGFMNSLWFASPPDATPQRYSRAGLGDALGSSGFLRFSPDSSKLVIWRGADSREHSGFWEIRMPDGEPRRLLSALTGPGLPPATFAWLKDNRRIVVTGATGPTPGSHLFVADTQTERVVPLTVTPGNEQAPSVSPDGRTVAFTRAETDFDLVEVPLDGSPLKPFLSTTRDEFDPAVSPVTTQFAFVTNRTGSQQIWLQNEEGYQSQPLVTESDFRGAESMAIGSLAISPDGTRLAFQRASSVAGRDRPAGSRLWVKSVSGGDPIDIPGSETFKDAPTWSPHGDWLAYLSGDLGNMTLLKSQIGGGGTPVVLLSAGIPPFVTRPQWSPDGDWILCETERGLTMIAADGSGRTRVVTDPGWLAYAWGSDGRIIYGLRPTDDEHHIMFVAVDSRTGGERIINSNLGPIPQALQPVRGFSRLKNGNFVTSLPHVRSDIYLLEGFQVPRPWWERLWRLGRPGE